MENEGRLRGAALVLEYRTLETAEARRARWAVRRESMDMVDGGRWQKCVTLQSQPKPQLFGGQFAQKPQRTL